MLYKILSRNKLQHEIFNNVVCVTSKDSDQPARTLMCKLILPLNDVNARMVI